ncbi:hypothetical protein A3D85_03085 [Candidatus Amesbacteria bacterium RIFCSPHIGHO2_02_FULL_47_9]|uniref:Uncharacterized protein n=1 Tax=Candidatus Amesbacteria bacterium RIFCSPHIGHO2_01_FULL_48_32b TaxID=1797253 RepID=A0A1F4YGQ2_9BACT|nr:MAG: hypothetical protein A2876_00710 [Candidatus Amesbacteria bacterium RIFCSPHIGHO2_01_FULL_48_32b]OGD02245.1 MAG: hypothetical protein A3D85_03085 [Candidatus Amesbacteria bacterium RIFCSPHIGHO2_02_FULL_47_9]OGD07462.1 MAG: hypothetical protein A2899_04125 [Candidatus Amesbacteria bacterium RIFCSPLOWO2_01_FULL_49_25]
MYPVYQTYFFFLARNLDNLDFSLEALFLLMIFFLAALSNCEKTAVRFFADGFLRITVTAPLYTRLVRLFTPAFLLSALSFLIAPLVIGIPAI